MHENGRLPKTSADCPRADELTHQSRNAHEAGCRCPEAVERSREARAREYERLKARQRTVPDVRPIASVEQFVRSHEQRACQGYATSLFFDPEVEDVAKSICHRLCPIEDDCLTAALIGNEIGVWGGTTAEQRDEMRALWTVAA